MPTQRVHVCAPWCSGMVSLEFAVLEAHASRRTFTPVPYESSAPLAVCHALPCLPAAPSACFSPRRPQCHCCCLWQDGKERKGVSYRVQQCVCRVEMSSCVSYNTYQYEYVGWDYGMQGRSTSEVQTLQQYWRAAFFLYELNWYAST